MFTHEKIVTLIKQGEVRASPRLGSALGGAGIARGLGRGQG